MRANIGDGFVALRLSRRNIMALLHMLDDRTKAIPALSCRDNHIELLVLPEEDDVHYAPERPAGPMSWENT